MLQTVLALTIVQDVSKLLIGCLSLLRNNKFDLKQNKKRRISIKQTPGFAGKWCSICKITELTHLLLERCLLTGNDSAEYFLTTQCSIYKYPLLYCPKQITLFCISSALLPSKFVLSVTTFMVVHRTKTISVLGMNPIKYCIVENASHDIKESQSWRLISRFNHVFTVSSS